jgi:hypothetical protein
MIVSYGTRCREVLGPALRSGLGLQNYSHVAFRHDPPLSNPVRYSSSMYLGRNTPEPNESLSGLKPTKTGVWKPGPLREDVPNHSWCRVTYPRTDNARLGGRPTTVPAFEVDTRETWATFAVFALVSVAK